MQVKLLKPHKTITFHGLVGLRLRSPFTLIDIQICCKHKQAVNRCPRGPTLHLHKLAYLDFII